MSLTSFTNCQNGDVSENEIKSITQEHCHNSRTNMALTFLAQFTRIWRLEAIEYFGVVALSVEMFGVALVSSMCWLGIYL
jgi:hypothetical protein